MSRGRRLSRPERQALRRSQREAIGSSVTSGVCDNYLGAFAIFLQASTQQVGWVVAIPQLVGAWAQLLSVWLGRHGVRCIGLILAGAAFQAAMVVVFIVGAIGLLLDRIMVVFQRLVSFEGSVAAM